MTIKKLSNSELSKITDKILKDFCDVIKDGAFSAKQKRIILESIIVEFLNTITPMTGATIQDHKINPSSLTKNLIQEIENNPKIAANRNKYYISAFANISASAAGLVYYVDSKSGKTFTLLERRKKDSYQWIFPAGYMEIFPANANYLIDDRISEEERYIIEENSVGNEVGEAKNNINYPREISTFKLPDANRLKEIIVSEYERMIHQDNWQEASRKLNDPTDLLKLLQDNNIDWPNKIDLNWFHTWQREVFEETGVDLTKYKNRITLQLKPNSTIVLATGEERLTNIDGRFCTFLGVLDHAPKLNPNYEMEDAKWVALQDIIFDAKQERYIVPLDGRPLFHYAVVMIEESLNELLNYKIRNLTKCKNEYNNQSVAAFDTPQNLQIYILKHYQKNYNLEKLPFINYILRQEFGTLGMVKTLFGAEGRKVYRAFLAVACYLSDNKLSDLQDFVSLNNFIEEIIKSPITIYERL